MPTFEGSLRGYSSKIFERDHYTCRYCGADGTKSFDTWLSLSRDHLLPKGYANWDNPDYMVTACQFCNTAANLYFSHASKEGFIFDGLTPDELVERRLPYVQKTRQAYKEYWRDKVLPLTK